MVNTQTFLDNVKSNVQTYIVAQGTYVATGTGTTASTTADTTLETEVDRNARQEYTVGTSDVVISGFWGTGEANGSDLTEVGILTASSGGTLIMRRVFPAVSKTAAVDLWIDVEELIDITQ